MIELIRIVENQATLSSYRATQNEEHALQLELLIEATKPKNAFPAWHPLIATPFRYSPPHSLARFRPSYGKNVFYGSFIEETALYEHAFHFIKERRHLNIKTDIGVRTIFMVDVNDKKMFDLRKHPNCSAIMDKNDYSASHHFIHKNPDVSSILYPSCRDPKKRDNAAILSIDCLGKYPKWESAIKFFYDNKKQRITWLDYDLHIEWSEIS